MNDIKTITGTNETEIWSHIQKDLTLQDVFEYNVIIEQQDRQIELNIDIDLGGGFEGGYEITSFRTLLTVPNDFRFAIHKEGFLDEIGKFFGMQDVELGYEEFDKKVIVKTNDEEKVKKIFSDADERNFFKTLDADYSFGITIRNHEKELELTIEKGVTDPVILQNMYHHFYKLLMIVDQL